MHSDNIGELAKALAAAQGEMKNAQKTSENPAFKRGVVSSKYADLAEVWDACRAPLSKHGLAIVQTATTEVVSGQLAVVVHTMLMHESNQWIRDSLILYPEKTTPHGIGSCITYGRRFSVAAFVGVVPTDAESKDDDGNAASGIEDKAAHAMQVVTNAIQGKPAAKPKAKDNGDVILDFSAWQEKLARETDPEVIRAVYAENFEGKNGLVDPDFKFRKAAKARITALEELQRQVLQEGT